MTRIGRFVVIFVLLVLFVPSKVRAQTPPAEPKTEKLDTERFEVAGFPILGGNSDIGVQFGGAATFTKFHDDVFPYLWNIDLLLSASAKSDSNGFRLVQQSHVLRLDAPDLFGGLARLDTRASFQRTIDQGYYGIGNASSATVPAGDTSQGRRFQYLQEETRVRSILRVHTPTRGIDLAFGANLRYETPSTYAGSKLDEDLAASGDAIGGASTFLAGVAAGLFYDTRDSEFITSRGVFYQLGAGATVGTADDVHYGNVSAVLAHYARLGGPFIFASRFVASFELGTVPFYDQQQGGTFEPQYLLGSENGVRGVPLGRYAGLAKIVTNTEIRVPGPRFRLLGQRLRLGGTGFFDAGRLWADYRFDPARDGTSLGLKFGVGGGAFLQWGEAAIFRVEIAYSPDAVSENPGFPVGIYVSDGTMF